MIHLHAVISRIFKLTRTYQNMKETRWQIRAKKLNPYPVDFVGQAFLFHEKNVYIVAFRTKRGLFPENLI